MPKIILPAKQMILRASEGKRAGKMNNEIITVAIVILPFVSAIEKANIAMAKAIMSPINPYGIPIIFSLR